MNKILYILLLVCSVFLGSCSHTKQAEDLLMKKEPSKEIPEVIAQEKEPLKKITEVMVQEKESLKQIPETLAWEKEPPPMIQIQNLSLTDKTLTLDYRVSNPFKEDIRVCYHPYFYGKEEAMSAAIRIDGETVRIQLRNNIEQFPGFEDPIPVGRYIRLQPGESCSGRIVRDLPIEDYVREWREDRKEHKEITLHHAIFEVGYFGPKWNKFFDSLSKWSNDWSKEKSIEPKPRIYGPYYYLPFSPLVTEETLDGQLREVIYLHDSMTPWVKNEEFKEVVMADVAILCSVVDDDKWNPKDTFFHLNQPLQMEKQGQ